MNFVKKRETPVQSIAFIGIMAAIDVVFVLITSLLPILFILLVFLLPLTSVLVTLSCKKFYFPIYFIATLALCFGVTAGFSIFDTLIYVLPSLITGFIFGILIEKKVSAIYILIINSVVQYLLTYLTFLFLDKVIGQVSFFDSIYALIGLANFKFKGILTNIFTYVIAQIQIILTYIFVKYEMIRINMEINLEIKNRFLLYGLTLVGGILSVISVFFFPEVTILLTLVTLSITVYEVIDLLAKRNNVIYFVTGFSLIAFIFLFAFLYQFAPIPNQLVLLNALYLIITIVDFLFNYCFKTKF
ncbi:MAG: hypothetical protein J6M95_02520 [Bacilli bacterium]|nr:hypothetical protein [Bacilli bacterium]